METIEVYEVLPNADFTKNADRLTKKKKFFKLPKQIRDLKEKFARGEFEGDRITHQETPAAYDVYKLRLPNPDTNVGKSDGYRVIYMVVTEKKIVVLLTMYYKKEDEAVSDTYITGLIDGYFLYTLPEEE
jgi:mRNA-degrading endonuclease RelE of RelBE toxin-antitoxin system